MKVPFGLALPLIASSACAFVVSPPSAPRHLTTLRLFESVEAAIADAQRICAADPASQECKVAWDIVEELEAADSHKTGIDPPNVLPQGLEYASFLQGFDILTQKIDGKMDQLKALTNKLAEMEADPSVTELGALSDEMKLALARVREVLRE